MNVGALSSNRKGSASGQILSVPCCQSFGLQLPEDVGSQRIAGTTIGPGAGALEGPDGGSECEYDNVVSVIIWLKAVVYQKGAETVETS